MYCNALRRCMLHLPLAMYDGSTQYGPGFPMYVSYLWMGYGWMDIQDERHPSPAASPLSAPLPWRQGARPSHGVPQCRPHEASARRGECEQRRSALRCCRDCIQPAAAAGPAVGRPLRHRHRELRHPGDYRSHNYRRAPKATGWLRGAEHGDLRSGLPAFESAGRGLRCGGEGFESFNATVFSGEG